MKRQLRLSVHYTCNSGRVMRAPAPLQSRRQLGGCNHWKTISVQVDGTAVRLLLHDYTPNLPGKHHAYTQPTVQASLPYSNLTVFCSSVAHHLFKTQPRPKQTAELPDSRCSLAAFCSNLAAHLFETLQKRIADHGAGQAIT